MKKLVSYFIQGLFLIVPITVIAYAVYKLFYVIDGLLPYHPFPGAGILIICCVITALGFLGNTLIAHPIKRIFNDLLKRAPLLKTIYSAITDLLSAFVGKKRRFNQPVLVKLSKESNIEKLGFITEEDLTDLGIANNKVAVYLPHSYNFSGNLFIVDKNNITPVSAKSADVMKFIVSGGITSVDDND